MGASWLDDGDDCDEIESKMERETWRLCLTEHELFLFLFLITLSFPGLAIDSCLMVVLSTLFAPLMPFESPLSIIVHALCLFTSKIKEKKTYLLHCATIISRCEHL